MKSHSQKILRQGILITVTFAILFGIVSLTMTQIITMEKYVLNILFLTLVSAIIIVCFKKTFIEILYKIDKSYLLLLFFSLTAHVTISYIILHYLERPAFPFSITGTSFLLLNNFFIWVKPLDVLVQQLMIIVLVRKFSELKLKYKTIAIICLFCFGIIHIFQVFKTSLIIGLCFTFVALLLSIVFPYLILKVKNGVIYSYVIHLGIYTLAALLSWYLF
jgi:hypothetical protein